MKEKKKGKKAKKTVICVLGILFFVLGVQSSGLQAMAEGEAGAYDKQVISDLLTNNEITASNGNITMQEKDTANGVIVSGSTKDLSENVFTFSKVFDFNQGCATRLVVDGLAEKRKNVTLEFYLDGSEKSFTSVTLIKQKRENKWSTVRNVSVDLSNLQLQGTHTITFKVVTDAKENVKFVLRSVEFMKTDLPMVSFDIDESQGTIEAMNGDQNHDTECYGNVTVQVPEGYKSEYSDETFSTGTYELEYLRGRGNSTWWASKKPYKFKLDKKADFFGMGKSKHWVLVANYYDVSMLRNKVTYWLGKQLGMEYTPECVMVDVVMNGQYLGSYYLCEQVRVENSRVDIDDLEKDEESQKVTSGAAITGGYLLSMFPYGDEDNRSFQTTQGNQFLIESPSFEDYENDAQYQYISNYVQKTEDAIYGTDFKDSEGVSYADYMDVDSAIDYYWIQEISSNGDAFGSTSTYLYKKRNGKLYWGPLWDFDYVAWGATEFNGNNCDGFSKNTSTWFQRLFQDPAFCQKVKNRWPAIREKLLEACKDEGQIDIYAKQMALSQKNNYDIWKKYSENMWDEMEQTEMSEVTYDGEVQRFKAWIKERVEWIDNNLDSIQPVIYNITYQVDGSVYQTTTISEGSRLGELPAEPVKKGYTFMGWYTKYKEDGKTYKSVVNSETEVTSDMIIYAKWEKDSAVVKAKKIVLNKSNAIVFAGDGISLSVGAIPFNSKIKDITWSSSDTEILTIEGDGMVSSTGKKGSAVITAQTADGLKATCKINVIDYNEGVYEAKDYSIKNSKVTMNAGAYKKINITTNPSDVYYINFQYGSSDTSVAEVNEYGYIYAKKAGTAVIGVYEGSTGKMKFCKVTVKAVVKKGSEFAIDGLQYKVLTIGNRKTVSCIGFSGESKKTLTIPDSITYQNMKYKVTAIGEKAFLKDTKLNKIIIGKNITTIGEKAFYQCKKLKSFVVKTEKLSKVGNQALEKTNKDMVISVPKGKEKQYKKLLEVS